MGITDNDGLGLIQLEDGIGLLNVLYTTSNTSSGKLQMEELSTFANVEQDHCYIINNNMPNLVTNKFKIHNAEQFIESLSESSATNLYLFIGKVDAWSDEASSGKQIRGKFFFRLLEINDISKEDNICRC